MKKWVLENKWPVTGALTGALGGFLYWYFIGCASGTCMITSKWLNSTLYGGLMGTLLFSMFKKEKNGNNA